jgi:hypothetical protein
MKVLGWLAGIAAAVIAGLILYPLTRPPTPTPCAVLLKHMKSLRRFYGHDGRTVGVDERPKATEAHLAVMEDIATNHFSEPISRLAQTAIDASFDASTVNSADPSVAQRSDAITAAVKDLEDICK